MSDALDDLKSLHTAVIDARNGYVEAIKDAEGKGLTPLFEKMMALHERHAQSLGDCLLQAGEKADTNGSFMSTVHRAVISVRSLFGGLDESILPGLIDGETRIISYYNEVLSRNIGAFRTELIAQRQALSDAIDEMTSMQVSSDI